MREPIHLLILDAPPAKGCPEADALRQAGYEPVVTHAGEDTAGLDEALAGADAILTLGRDVDAAMIAKAGRCQIIVHYGPGAGPGVARVDLAMARRLGIYVTSIPDWAAGEWAGRTMELVEELFAQRPIAPRTGRKPTLKKLRLGLVGLGCVGREVARQAVRREMEVWACDPFAEPEHFLTLDVHEACLEELLGICDIVSLHVPLGPATRGMIDRQRLGLLKKGALLINASSPELIDLDALTQALLRGHPAGAAFDENLKTFLPETHPLLAYPAVIHGPRRAGVSEAACKALRTEAGRLLAFMWRGNRPPHLLIDPPCPRHVLSMAGRDSFEA